MTDGTLVYKVYGIIDVSTLAAVPNETQWQALVNIAKTYPWEAALITAARASQNQVSAHKRARGTGLMKYTLFVYEIDAEYKVELLALLDSLAAQYGVTGTLKQKLAGVHQYELRAAAVALGYSQAQADKIVVTIINNGGWQRDDAIAAVQAYLVAQNGIWHG